MKNIFTLLLSCWTSLLIAQISGNLTADTTLANQYIEQAQQMEEKNEGYIGLAKKAFDIYSAYPELPKYIQAKGLYAYAVYLTDEEKGVALANETIELAKKKLGEEMHPFTIEAFMVLIGYNFYTLRNHELAMEYSLKLETIVPPLSINFFKIKLELANICLATANSVILKTVTDELESAFNEMPEGSLHEFRLDFYQSMMKYTRYFLHNFEKAISYTKAGYAITDSTDQVERLVFVMELCVLYARFFPDKKEETEKWCNLVWEYESYSEQLPDNNRPWHFVQLGDICKYRGQFELSKSSYQKAIDIFLERPVIDSNGISFAYSKLSSWAYLQDDRIEAVKYGKKSISYNETNVPEHYGISVNLGTTDRFDEIFYHLQKANEVLVPGFKPVDNYDNPPHHLKTIDAYWSAYVAGHKASSIFRYYNWQDSLTRMEKLELMGKCLESAKLGIRYQQEHIRKNIDGYEEVRFNQNSVTLNIFSMARLALNELYLLNPDRETFDEMYHYTERRKAMLLIEYLNPKKLPRELVEREIALKEKIEWLNFKLATVQKDSVGFYENQLFETILEFDQYKKQVEEQFPKESNNFYNIPFAKPDEIAKQLDDETLFVNFDVDEHTFSVKTGTWLNITAIGGEERKVVQVKQDTIYGLLEKMEKLNKNPLLVQKKNRQEFIRTSHQIYKILFGPIKDVLKGKTKLIVVQEGIMHHVPFDLLLTSGEDKPFHELPFLIKQYDISYQYSGTAYLNFKEKPSVQDGSMLAFAPVFTTNQNSLESTSLRGFLVDSLHRGVENDRYLPLPNSKKEVEYITAHPSIQGNHQLLLEKEATKENLLQTMQSRPFQFVHLASHGLVNLENHRLSGLACWHEDKEDDALLFATEIQQSDIQADIVVLSSCESGVGKAVQGEGLIAINRSFFYAGAKNVLFSLWKVNDKYTSDLMIGFYKNYFETKDYSAALRQTKLDMISDPTTANPRFWAPFVLIGE